VVYQNIGPAIAPFASLLGGLMPQRPGQRQPGQQPANSRVNSRVNDNLARKLGSMKPTLMAAYAEPDRLTVAANADLIGPSIASLMGATSPDSPVSGVFLSAKGTRERQMSYR